MQQEGFIIKSSPCLSNNMPTTITLTGVAQLTGFLKAMPELAIIQAAMVLNVTAAKIAADVKQLISTTGAPDGVPRRRTGNLLMSVSAGRQRMGFMKITQYVGVNPDGPDEWGYAGYLEYGTSRMKPRPYLTPTVEKNSANFHAQLKKALDQKLTF
jgi:HK97 gp10 family phage protein